MAGGWSRDGAVQDQINASVEDALAQARARLPQGESRAYCMECDEAIPEARRHALPGVTLCVHCQQQADEGYQRHQLFNRRGSKDSQLR